jgi:hypothetical protein
LPWVGYFFDFAALGPGEALVDLGSGSGRARGRDPHVGGFTAESVRRTSEGAVDAILDVLRSGQVLKDLPAGSP